MTFRTAAMAARRSAGSSRRYCETVAALLCTAIDLEQENLV
jgi:hypothetical protein